MFNVTEEDQELSFRISSERGLVDRIVVHSQEFLASHGVPYFSNFNVALRELLMNAVEHGNENNVRRAVSCLVKMLPDSRIKIIVEDEGQGFEHAKLDLSLPEDPEQIRHRGLALANAFSDHLAFNDKGNRATAIIVPVIEIAFSVSQDGAWQVIVPSGDITANVADKFRLLLIELLEAGHTHFRFNLANVQDLDSISLSVFVVFSTMLSKGEADWDLEVTNANADLRNLFQLTRLDKSFKISAPERN